MSSGLVPWSQWSAVWTHDLKVGRSPWFSVASMLTMTENMDCYLCGTDAGGLSPLFMGLNLLMCISSQQKSLYNFDVNSSYEEDILIMDNLLEVIFESTGSKSSPPVEIQTVYLAADAIRKEGIFDGNTCSVPVLFKANLNSARMTLILAEPLSYTPKDGDVQTYWEPDGGGSLQYEATNVQASGNQLSFDLPLGELPTHSFVIAVLIYIDPNSSDDFGVKIEANITRS
ncbi:hypothetical protein [Spirulina major]|uniref:hypothetical protein n=1 Tax=Spirulina major TaxID=270636 RepID=UPI001114F9A6|nr:hypothetical protein [Spirulina major]